MGRSGFLPFLAMVAVQIGYAGMNISSKVAMDSGMPPLVLVAYRQIFATFALLPFAYFFEWKTRPRITKKILFQVFLCSICGATLNQMLFFLGLNNTTATISCALSNTLPAITFILAAFFRMEAVGIRSRGGQAKIIGTIVCVGGAILLSFYHGQIIKIGQSGIHWSYTDDKHTTDKNNRSISDHQNFFLGAFLLLASNLAMAIWFILQAKMSKTFAAPYTSSALMCLMASIQCTVIAACNNHDMVDWSLTSRIRIFASVYAGIVGSALAFWLMCWTIQRKGPLYVSVFNPLLLVIVALLSWALSMEKLYVGTVVGSVLIVLGLYAVLWGKNKEMVDDNIPNTMDLSSTTQGSETQREDLEKQQQIVGLKGDY